MKFDLANVLVRLATTIVLFHGLLGPSGRRVRGSF